MSARFNIVLLGSFIYFLCIISLSLQHAQLVSNTRTTFIWPLCFLSAFYVIIGLIKVIIMSMTITILITLKISWFIQHFSNHQHIIPTGIILHFAGFTVSFSRCWKHHVTLRTKPNCVSMIQICFALVARDRYPNKAHKWQFRFNWTMSRWYTEQRVSDEN